MHLFMILTFLHEHLIFSSTIAECGGSFSKFSDFVGPETIDDINKSCADHMANASFAAENYGERFGDKFESYYKDYYRADLDNSKKLTDIISNLDDPNNSPMSKTIENMSNLNNFVKEDVLNTNSDNLKN